MADDVNDRHPGAKTTTTQEAEAQAVRDKIARLRALRLAHEAANPSVGAKGTPARSRAGKKTSAGKSVPLSDWLSDQEQQGRRK